MKSLGNSSFWQRRAVRYGMALVATGLSALVRWALPSVLSRAPYLGFYPAVVVAAVLGGVGPGLVATFASLLLVNFIFVQFHPLDYGLQMRNVVWIVGSVGVSLLAGKMRTAQRQSAHRASFPELNPNPIFETDLAGELTYLNPAARAQFPDLEETGAVHPLLQDWPALIASFREGRERTIVREAETDARTFMQTIVPCAELGTVRSYLLDITQRKQAEETVTRSQRTFSHLVERAPFGIYVVDSQFRIAQMNVGSQNGAFRNVRPVIGRDFAEAMRILWPEPVAAEIIADFRHTLQTGEPYYSPRFTNPRQDVGIVESYEWELHRITLPDGQFGVICYYFDSTELRNAEAALRESERRLLIAKEAAGLGIHDYDVRSGVIQWDAHTRALWGVGPDEPITYQTFMAGVHPDDRARVQSIVDKSLDPAGSGTYYAEYRVRCRTDNVERWVAANGHVVFQDNTAVRLVGTVQDITERQRAEAALRQSEARLRAIMDTVPDPIFLKDAQGRVLMANTATFAVIGKPPEQVLGKTDREFYDDPATGEAIAANDRRILQAGQAERVEELIQTDAGTRVFASTKAPYRDPDGNIIGLVGVATDITARKQAEQALRESEERFRVAQELSPDGFTILSPIRADDGEIVDFSWVYQNESIARISRTDPKTIVGKRLLELFPRHRGTKFFDAYKQVAETGESCVFEDEYGDENIPKTWFRLAVVPTGGDIAILAQDITHQKRAQELLVRSEKVAALGRMAASLAHDINNPLAAVMNTVYIAQHAADCPDSVRQHLRVMDEELKRIAHLTKQALGFYREDSKPSKTTVHALLDEALGLFGSKLAAKGVTIEKQYRDGLEITAVAGELRQVFSNLIANSLDAIATAGVIKLRISSFERPDHRYLRVTMADNGRGIEPDARPHIFEPLFTTKGPVGTGLGLWVSRQLVEKHGGSIRVYSSTRAPRSGTTVSIVLPLGAAASAPASVAQPAHVAQG